MGGETKYALLANGDRFELSGAHAIQYLGCGGGSFGRMNEELNPGLWVGRGV